MKMRKFMVWIVVAQIAALAAVPARGVAQAPTFNTIIATPTGSQPWQPPGPAAVGDFNGDGKMDALIVDGTASARFMYGNGDGTFSRFDINAEQMTTGNMVNLPADLVQYMPKSIDGYILIKAADVNGDGKLDAICATTVHINFGPYSLVTVLINTGNDADVVPQFSTTNYFLGFYDVRSLTAGDLNGDDKPEFIVGSAYAGLYIYRNNGDGTFTPGQVTSIMPNAGGPAVGVGVITDVNGDGNADFVVTSGQADATDVFLGNGDGTLQAPSIVSPAASYIAVADLDNDGKPDLIEGLGDGSVSVYLGNGNGTFGSPANFPSGAASWPSGFFISDVNGDGNLDVAASLPAIAKVAILTGNGDGTLSSPYLYDAMPNIVDVTLADFTGDGKPDIASVSANGYGGQNFVVLTNTTPFPQPAPHVVVDPDKVNFGDIQTGTEGHGEVHIVNIGDAPLYVSGISGPQGAQSSFFDVFFEVSLPTWVQPGEELVVHTKFRPQDQTFYQSFFDVFTNDPNAPAVRVNLCGNGVFPPTTLHFEEAFARPGGHAVVDVAVESNQSIAGLQFKIQPYCNGNPAWLVHFNGLINDLEQDGWTATFHTDADGVTTVLFFHTGGGALPPYQHHKILELVFDIDPAISFGKWIDLVTWDVVISDPNSQPLPFNLWQGKIHIGHPGDIAGGQLGGGDGHADILDIIKLVKKLLGLLPQPEWGTFDFFLCDVNGDGYINILDLVALISDVLESGPSKVIADGPTSPVTVSLGDVQAGAGGQLAVPVTLTANGSLAGLQATFTFDAAQLSLGTPQLVGAAAGMTLQSQIVDGRLQVVIYSASGQVIPAGRGAMLVIPATLLGDGAPELTLADVLVADRGAQAVPVVLGTSTVKVAPLPTAFALKGARPNPFNPTTRVAYEVPKAAHIVVAVYNLLGQEVIRLVDAEQQPGRYEVVWQGRNAQGLSVASGVYLYRLTSSTGFSETKRMTLLK